MRQKYVTEAIFDQEVALAPKPYEIRPKLLLTTNRNAHTRYRLVPNLMTLNSLEPT